MLKDLFNDDYCVYPNGGELELTENDPGAKLRQVTVRGVPEGALALRLDTGDLGYFLRREAGERRCCDYVLIVYAGERRHLIFIEMKSEHFEMRRVREQFLGAECAVAYCEAVLERFHEAPEFFGAFEWRYFVVHRSRSIQKRTTRPKTNPYPTNSPQAAHKYPFGRNDNPKIPFRALVGP